MEIEENREIVENAVIPADEESKDMSSEENAEDSFAVSVEEIVEEARGLESTDPSEETITMSADEIIDEILQNGGSLASEEETDESQMKVESGSEIIEETDSADGACDNKEEDSGSAENDPAEGKQQDCTKGFDSYVMLYDLVRLLAIITVVFVFFLRLVNVDGSSMFPTFVNRDYLILESNFLYRNVQSSDIVVLKSEFFESQGPLVKRVIATGGQTVDIDFDTGDVRVDGVLLDEPYICEPTNTSFGSMGLDYPVTVPEDCVFVMGDNRNNSSDSRLSAVGCVSKDQILGKVLFVLFPGKETDKNGALTGNRDFSRIGTVR